MRRILPFFFGLLLTIGGTVSPLQVHAQPSKDGQGSFSFTPESDSAQWYCNPQRHCDPSDCVVTSSLSPSSTSASFLLTATTTTQTALYVEYEPTDPVSGVPRLRSLPSTCGTSHTVSLDRLLASTSYSYDMYYLRSRHPFTPVRILSGTFISSPLPSTIAAVDFTRVSGRASYHLGLSVYPSPSTPTYPATQPRDTYGLIFDRDGRIVWWLDMVHPLSYFNGFGFSKKGRTDIKAPIGNNKWLHYVQERQDVNMNVVSMGTDRIIEYSPSGSVAQSAQSNPDCQYLHHEAELDAVNENLVWSLGRKSFAAPGYASRQLGDTAVLWDASAPGNPETQTVFEYADYLNVDDRTEDSNTTDPFWAGCPVTGDVDRSTEDWTHGNSLKRAEDGSNLLLASFRHLNAIVAMDGIDEHGNPTSGGIRKAWQIGGEESDFTFTNEEDTFYHQHDAYILTNGHVLLFDNGNFRPEGEYSRGLELQIDKQTHTVTKVWEGVLTLDNGLKCFSFCCGSIQRLKNGNTLVQFPNCVNEGYPFPGRYAYTVEFDPSGDIVSKYRTTLTDFVAFYRSREIGSSIGGEVEIKRSK
jgi:hypothetical protein